MEKHTKGPWKASHNPSSEIREGFQIGMWERDVTANTGFGPSATGIGETREEADANAHLIAAAPDLLSLAKMFEAHIMGHRVGNYGKLFTGPELLEFIKQQINKAQGKL